MQVAHSLQLKATLFRQRLLELGGYGPKLGAAKAQGLKRSENIGLRLEVEPSCLDLL